MGVIAMLRQSTHDNSRAAPLRLAAMHSETSKGRCQRMKAIAAGLVLVAVGVLRLREGVEVVTHSIGQPVFSWGLIAAGLVCIVFAFVPNMWIAKAARGRITGGISNKRGR
jgi:hypothetical protein